MSDEMVYHHAPKADEVNETTTTSVEQSDRGLFDFMSKKKEEENKSEEAAISSEFDQKVQVSEPEPKPADEEKHETLFQKMHQSHSGSSSSSSSDEEGEDGEKKEKKKKKNKSLTTQINEKIEERKEKKEEEKMEKHEDDTCVPVEQYVEVAAPPHVSEVAHPIPTPEPEEKKGFMEKLKEKLPGGHKKAEEEQHVAPPPPSTPAVEAHDEDKEKKGIFEKIKEKIPGYHSKSEEEKEKEKVKECD